MVVQHRRVRLAAAPSSRRARSCAGTMDESAQPTASLRGEQRTGSSGKRTMARRALVLQRPNPPRRREALPSPLASASPPRITTPISRDAPREP